MTRSAPAPVRRLVRRWIQAGRPPQAAMQWPRERWIAYFERHRAYLSALPDNLDRAVVRSKCAPAADSPEAAVQGFLAAMAWGYGSVGYGPWRVHRVLSQNRASARKLQAVAATVLSDGPVAAYSRFSDYRDCRLRHLGPAFGTKYLAFCCAEDQPPALILDRLVTTWLRANVDLGLDSVTWRPATYERYLAQMQNWAEALDLRADELECRIFTAQADQTDNEWSITAARARIGQAPC